MPEAYHIPILSIVEVHLAARNLRYTTCSCCKLLHKLVAEVVALLKKRGCPLVVLVYEVLLVDIYSLGQGVTLGVRYPILECSPAVAAMPCGDYIANHCCGIRAIHPCCSHALLGVVHVANEAVAHGRIYAALARLLQVPLRASKPILSVELAIAGLEVAQRVGHLEVLLCGVCRSYDKVGVVLGV